MAALKHGQMSLESICEALSDIPRTTIQPNLTRMVKSGKLIRPEGSMYGLNLHVSYTTLYYV